MTVIFSLVFIVFFFVMFLDLLGDVIVEAAGHLIRYFFLALFIALKFSGKGLLWVLIRIGKGVIWVCVRAGRGTHFTGLVLYFLIEEKLRGAPDDEGDEEPEEWDDAWDDESEEPSDFALSETAYEAALATLGLEAGFTRDVLNKAYKQLMVKAHPDRPGGSTRAAQAINTSRDLVMDWHGWA